MFLSIVKTMSDGRLNLLSTPTVESSVLPKIKFLIEPANPTAPNFLAETLPNKSLS